MLRDILIRRCSWAAGAALAIACGATLLAQPPRPSQHGTVSQTIAATKVTIDYNRPVARGRVLFGGLVPWGRIWCPGADMATSITLTTDVQINGQKLVAGSYSVWAEPQKDKWTVIFNRENPVWHTRHNAEHDVLHLTTAPRQGSHMETLAFYFPVVDGRKAELVLHWGTVVVPLDLEVP